MNNNNTNIIEINEDQFQESVLESSKTSLILVDFWAPWCGPCKQLTPILEKIVDNLKGKVKLIKINIDENQQIASQMRIQSIPAVFAFKDGKPVDAFQGVLPEKKIVEFIEKSLGEKLEEDHTNFYREIELLTSEKKFSEAKEILEKFIMDYPTEYRGFSTYIEIMGIMGLYDEIEEFTKSLSEEAMSNEFIKSSLKKISIVKKNANAPSIDDLLNLVNKNPKNLNNLINLADKYFAENMFDESFEILLQNFKANKEKIKVKFLEYFQALGNENEITAKYRKKLSSIMFS